jgi:POT family proton-dependent oligopeptide transporter
MTSAIVDAQEARLNPAERIGLIGGISLAVLIVGFGLAGLIKFNPVVLARSTTTFIVAVAVLYFACVLLFAHLDKTEKQRVGVIVVLFISAALFWAGFEQAGSSFNLFAERYTARNLGFLDFMIPAGWFQSLGPVFIISLAPVAAALWVSLARRHLNPSLPVKFACGLVLLAAGFLVLAAAAKFVAAGQKVWPTWLIMTYLLHTFGELCVSPVGLSSVTKLAPRRLTGQMMGTWFLAASLGNLLAGLLAGELRSENLDRMPVQYFQMAVLPLAAGIGLALLARPIKKWMAGIE